MRHTMVTAVCAAGGALTLALAACSSSDGTATRGDDATVQTVTVTESAEPTTVTVEQTTTVEVPSDGSGDSGSGDAGSDGTADTGSADGDGGDTCQTSDMDISLKQGGAAAGSQYFDIVFTNTGDAPCTLQGFPKVAYVTGDDGTQVGAAATEDGDAGGAVTLKPSESASASLQEPNVMNYDPDDCDPVSVRGLRVYPPGESHAAFLPQKGAQGCKSTSLPGGGSQLSVQAVTAGSSSQ